MNYSKTSKTSFFNATLLILGLFTSSTAFAQPSDTDVKQRAINAGAIETRFTGDKGTVHTALTEKWYIRTMESKWKTDYGDIKRWERTEYRYNYTGGKWVFSKSYPNSSWFEGIPNPTETEIIAILERSKVGNQNAVLERPIFKLATDPKWNWHTVNSVEFMVEAIFYEKTTYTEVAKKKVTMPIRLYKDTGNGQHDPNKKVYIKEPLWMNVHSPTISSSYGSQEILETKEYTSSEADKIKTFLEQELDAEDTMNNQQFINEEVEEVEEVIEITYPSFKINDAVIVNWNGQNRDYYKGKIIKIDPYNEHRYFIEFDEIQSAWIEAKFISLKN